MASRFMFTPDGGMHVDPPKPTPSGRQVRQNFMVDANGAIHVIPLQERDGVERGMFFGDPELGHCVMWGPRNSICVAPRRPTEEELAEKRRQDRQGLRPLIV